MIYYRRFYVYDIEFYESDEVSLEEIPVDCTVTISYEVDDEDDEDFDFDDFDSDVDEKLIAEEILEKYGYLPEYFSYDHIDTYF